MNRVRQFLLCLPLVFYVSSFVESQEPTTLFQRPLYCIASKGGIELAKTRLSQRDERLQVSLDALIAQAERALSVKPLSVTHKAKPGPSGDLHDYVSTAPYFWPDPDSPSGLPYIAKDGKVNPESRTENSDQPRAELLSDTVTTLAMAYYFTGNEQYAEHASICLRVWFLDRETAMKPHLEYAQGIPGKNHGRDIGIIEGISIVGAADAAGFLIRSQHWTFDDQRSLHAWLDSYLHWLQTSPNGVSEGNQVNNHGTMYDVQVMRLALMLNKNELAKQIAEQVKTKRIAIHIEPDGSQPKELRRTKALSYSRLNLRGLTMLADMADRVGVDVWGFETEDGRSLRKAIDFLVPYIDDPNKPWPYQQIVSMSRSELAPILRRAAIAYRELKYEAIVEKYPSTHKSSFQLITPLPDDWPATKGVVSTDNR